VLLKDICKEIKIHLNPKLGMFLELVIYCESKPSVIPSNEIK
jgi:hypothetical protein